MLKTEKGWRCARWQRHKYEELICTYLLPGNPGSASLPRGARGSRSPSPEARLGIHNVKLKSNAGWPCERSIARAKGNDHRPGKVPA